MPNKKLNLLAELHPAATAAEAFLATGELNAAAVRKHYEWANGKLANDAGHAKLREVHKPAWKHRKGE